MMTAVTLIQASITPNLKKPKKKTQRLEPLQRECNNQISSVDPGWLKLIPKYIQNKKHVNITKKERMYSYKLNVNSLK
jgi:hypothetical protein